MIESIEIKNLRGIREGTLQGLTPLTVLVGPNSSGKSTVLDALLIGASPDPGDAVGRVVQRRSQWDADAQWLLWRQGYEGDAVLKVQSNTGTWRASTLSYTDEDLPSMLSTKELRRKGGHSPFSAIKIRLENGHDHLSIWTGFAYGNIYMTGADARVDQPKSSFKITPQVSLLDMRRQGQEIPLPNLYTAAVSQGRREEVIGLLAEIVPGLSHMEILVNAKGEPVLHLVFSKGSVPVVLAGDGIQAVLRLSLELANRNDGVVLIEEPEVHQHPRALQQSARALLASMRRGLQIVLSTHSLELIDALLAEATHEDLPKLSTYRLNLKDGVLVSSRFEGNMMALARGQIEEDLR